LFVLVEKDYVVRKVIPFYSKIFKHLNFGVLYLCVRFANQ